jgi:hypothetical protein
MNTPAKAGEGRPRGAAGGAVLSNRNISNVIPTSSKPCIRPIANVAKGAFHD